MRNIFIIYGYKFHTWYNEIKQLHDLSPFIVEYYGFISDANNTDAHEDNCNTIDGSSSSAVHKKNSLHSFRIYTHWIQNFTGFLVRILVVTMRLSNYFSQAFLSGRNDFLLFTCSPVHSMEWILHFPNLQAIEAKLAGIHSYTGVDWTMNEKGFFQSCVSSTRKVMFGMVTQAEEVIYFPIFLTIF